MFEHIVVPLDGSALAECVLPHVVTFTRAFNARVTLLQVLDNESGTDQEQPIDPLNWELRRVEAKTYLDDVARRLRTAGLDVQQSLLEGDPAQRIVEYIRGNDANLVILSSHGKSGLSRWNISSVVVKITQRTHTATLIVRAYQPAAPDLEGLCYKRILVPLDGSQRAEFVLPAVIPLAEACSAQLLLAHVVYRPDMPRRAPPSQQDSEMIERFVARSQEVASRYLEQVQSRFGSKAEIRLQVSDDVIGCLQDMVESDAADLVVLSAHGHSGSPRRPHGSMTTSFIEYDSAPLLVVQDLPSQEMEPTEAEIAAQEEKGH
jgi:nucleotide-binding universal stress UspA family protein